MPEADAIANMRAAGLEPLEPYPGARKAWRCRCVTCGSDVAPTLDNIRRGQGGCRNCAPNAPIAPDEAEAQMRAAGLEPMGPFPGVVAPWPSRCLTCGNEVSPSLHSIRQGRGGCRYCAGNAPISAEEAEAQMHAAGLTPLDPYPAGVLKPWRCQCARCGRETTTSLANVRHGGGSCRYCTGWEISTDEAEAQMRDAGFKPLEPYSGSSTRPWRCQCLRCGKESRPYLTAVRLQGTGCRYCAPNAPLDAAKAEAQMRAAGLEPLEPCPGSDKAWRCRCVKCGHVVSPALQSVRNGGGCRFCAEHGFDFTAPSIVYVLHHAGLGAHKVGIASMTSNRTQQLASDGWQTFRTLHCPTGYEAFCVEQAVLAPYRAALFCPYLSASEMPLGGHTETIDAEAVSLLDLWAEVAAAAEDIGRPGV